MGSVIAGGARTPIEKLVRRVKELTALDHALGATSTPVIP